MPLVPAYSNLTYKVDNIHGRKIEKWLWFGRLHSVEDRPSLIVNDGEEMQWHTQGTLHRADGPAFINSIGKKVWYNIGEIHRKGGPAKIYPDGKEEWYWHGFKYDDPADYFRVADCDTPEMVMAKLKYM